MGGLLFCGVGFLCGVGLEAGFAGVCRGCATGTFAGTFGCEERGGGEAVCGLLLPRDADVGRDPLLFDGMFFLL